MLPVFNGNGYYPEDPERWKNDDWWFSVTEEDGEVTLETTNALIAPVTLSGTIAPAMYYLEELSATQSQGSLEAGIAFDASRYKVTARGFGSTENATAILQTVFLR